MMMTSRVLSADEAYRVGLVDILSPVAELGDVLAELVNEITTNSWFTHQAVKRLFIETEGMPLADALAYERRNYPGAAPDHLERIAAISSGKRRKD